MGIYRIIDLNVKLDGCERTMKNAEPYLIKDYDGSYDFEVKRDTEAAVKDLYEKWRGYRDIADFIYESRQFHTKILDYDGMMLHASAVVADGEAYLFSAPSGTGKSTHTALWQRHFGGRVQMINDDKPIIRKKGGVFYVYGTPWMGKSNIGANISAPLGAVFLFERDRVNYAEKVSAGKVFPKLLEATLISKKQDRMSKILELYDEIFSAVDLYSLHCTISDDAVTAAYDAICK